MHARHYESRRASVLLLAILIALYPHSGQAIGVSPTNLTFQSNKPDQARLKIQGESQDTTAVNLWLLKREAGKNVERWHSYEGDAIDIIPPQFIVEGGDSVVATITWNSMQSAETSLSFYVVIETLPIRLEERWNDEKSELVMTTRIYVPLHVKLPEKKRNIEITSSYNLSNDCVMIKNVGNHYKALSDLTLELTTPYQDQPVKIIGREIAERVKSDALIPEAEYCFDLKE